jgi:hypothetical protein
MINYTLITTRISFKGILWNSIHLSIIYGSHSGSAASTTKEFNHKIIINHEVYIFVTQMTRSLAHSTRYHTHTHTHTHTYRDRERI